MNLWPIARNLMIIKKKCHMQYCYAFWILQKKRRIKSLLWSSLSTDPETHQNKEERCCTTVFLILFWHVLWYFDFCLFLSHPETLHLSPYIVHVPRNLFVTLQPLFPLNFWLRFLTNFQTFYRRLQFFWQFFVFFIDLFLLSFWHSTTCLQGFLFLAAVLLQVLQWCRNLCGLFHRARPTIWR